MGLGWVCAWGPLVGIDAAALLRGRRGTWWHPLSFHAAAVALVTSTVVLRGRRGTCGTGLGLVRRLGPVGRD